MLEIITVALMIFIYFTWITVIFSFFTTGNTRTNNQKITVQLNDLGKKFTTRNMNVVKSWGQNITNKCMWIQYLSKLGQNLITHSEKQLYTFLIRHYFISSNDKPKTRITYPVEHEMLQQNVPNGKKRRI